MNYLLLGLGKSNKSIQKYFNREKITYIIYDDYKYNIDIDFSRISTIIKSPGIYPTHEMLKRNVNIVTDLELFYLFSENKNFITVTGSNGKTTTVNIIKHLLPDLDLGGNVGYPLFDFIDSKNDIIIEASSFMLEFVKKFRSKYTVLLNIYKTHLEHHQSFSNYIKSKMNIVKNILEDDYLIYNYDDELVRRLVENVVANKIPFSKKSKIGVYFDGKNIIYKDKIVYNIEHIKLKGVHNIENILASVAVVLSYGRKVSGLDSIEPIKYRLQYKGTYLGVEIYNDSKSTNYYALNSALNSFKDNQLLLIVGGKNHQDKNYNFDYLDNISRIYFFGENVDEMMELFKTVNCEKYQFNTLEEVIKNINLKDVNIILFSPGSVSYDQYASFEDRGNDFDNLIEKYLKVIP